MPDLTRYHKDCFMGSRMVTEETVVLKELIGLLSVGRVEAIDKKVYGSSPE